MLLWVVLTLRGMICAGVTGGGIDIMVCGNVWWYSQHGVQWRFVNLTGRGIDIREYGNILRRRFYPI